MTKYTAADFANAKFAEHEDGRLAVRSDPSDHGAQWVDGECDWHSDEVMADDGWVPVPTKPTITESTLEEFYIAAHEIDGRVSIEEAARSLGYEIVPDPEPTNKARLAQLIGGGIKANKQYADGLAEYLDDMGVTAPNVKGN